MRENIPKVARHGLWLIVGLELTSICLQISTSAVGMATSVTVATFGLLGIGWLILLIALAGGRQFRRPLWLGSLMLVTIIAVALWAGSQIAATPGYGVDEAALDQWAAQLALHGANPYTHSLGAALRIFSVPMSGRSFLRDGHLVTTLSYPALAFEIYYPFLLLGWTTQLAIVTNVALWILTILLIYCWLPRSAKPLALVVALFPLYLNYVISGFAVVIALPLVVWAARRLPDERRDLRHWYGSAVLLGFAAAVNQWVWVLLPFVWAAHLIAPSPLAATKRWRWGRVLIHSGLTLGAFALPNLPFILRNFPAWWHGVLYPLIAPLVPAGQGWTEVALSGIGNVGTWHQTTVFAIFTGMLILYARYANAWESLTFVIPGVVLFWASRSFSLYWMLGVVPSLTLYASGQVAYPGRKELRAFGAGVVTLVSVALVSSLLVPGIPARLQVVNWSQGGPDAYINAVTVRLHNIGSYPMVLPTLFLSTSTGLMGTWHPNKPNVHLIPPRATRQLTLTSSQFDAMLPPGSPFRIVAVSATGATIASSIVQPPVVHLTIQATRMHQTLTIRVSMRGLWDQPLHEAGARIALSQVIDTPSGILPGTATINHAPPGQSPVVARTNRNGVATFGIRLLTIKQVVTFQANLLGRYGIVANSLPVAAYP